jgi:alpha-1,2-mannosyltransferase
VALTKKVVTTTTTKKGTIVAVDSYYYGKTVVAPLNLVFYNVLSSNTSSELYGTEPWSFYILNGALNFNILFALALASPLLLVSLFLLRTDLYTNALVGV